MATRNVGAFGVLTSNTKSIASTGMISVAGTLPVDRGAQGFLTHTLRVIEFTVVRAMNGATNKVIPLRKNRDTDPSNFTWRRASESMQGDPAEISVAMPPPYGPTTHPIGYWENGSAAPLEVIARFEVTSGATIFTTLEIYDSDGTKLGTSNEVTVTRTGADYTFIVSDFSVRRTGFYKTDLRFQWRYRIENRGLFSEVWRVPFYNFPNRPTEPWNANAPGRENNPWTDALDLMLNESHTRSAFDNLRGDDRRNPAKIASIITEMVNKRLGLVYIGIIQFGYGTVDGPVPDTFDLTRFIDRVVARLGDPSRSNIRVNCEDCANIVTTFSNLLGCDLNVLRFGNGFTYNKIRLIGGWEQGALLSGWLAGGFGTHEVAMVGANFDHRTRIYDACLEVDANVFVDPSQSAPVPLLPAHMQFASRIQFPPEGVDPNDTSAHHYIELLVVNEQTHLNNATQIDRTLDNRGRRRASDTRGGNMGRRIII